MWNYIANHSALRQRFVGFPGLVWRFMVRLRSEQRFQHSKFHRLSTIWCVSIKTVAGSNKNRWVLWGAVISISNVLLTLFPIEAQMEEMHEFRSKELEGEVLCICKVSLLFEKLQLDVATDLTKRQSFGFAGGQRRWDQVSHRVGHWQILQLEVRQVMDGYENEIIFWCFFCGMALKLVQLQELLGKEHGCFDGSICGPEFAAIEANYIFVGNW